MLQRTVILGVGSNIDPLQNLRLCLQEVKKLVGVSVLSVSKIYESDAMLKENAPESWNQFFLNAAIKLQVENFDPLCLLQDLKLIEQKLNRQTLGIWSPRTIDIDILYVDQFSYQSDKLTIPHCELEKRPFALMPLLDIFPEYQVQNCLWLNDIIKPFNTKKSDRYFWPKLVGILNITTDSFSDGGLYFDQNRRIDFTQLEKTLTQFITSEADVIDIGAESTRPNAVVIDEQIEFDRLNQTLQFVQEFQKNQKRKFKISLDCRKPHIVQKIIHQFDIDYINDVEGFRHPDMIRCLQNTDAKVICMHSFSVPPIKTEVIPSDKNIFLYLTDWWNQKLENFMKHKISTDRLIFDIGIGFGKTPEQSFELLENLEKFKNITHNIYIGHSRKSFLSLKTKAKACDRDDETAQVTARLNQAYCQYLRVHQIEINKRALL